MTTVNNAKHKLINFGADALTDSELLCLLLANGHASQNSKALLNTFGGLVGVFEASLSELKAHLPDEDAIRLNIFATLSKRASEQTLTLAPKLDNHAQLLAYFQHKLSKLNQETISCIFLDAQLRLIDSQLYPSKNATQIYFPLRDILSVSLNSHTYAIAIAHNHPSGNALPSNADIVATQALKTHLAAVDIELLDHMIIAQHNSFSFRQERLLD